jgi:hypothetical protein
VNKDEDKRLFLQTDENGTFFNIDALDLSIFTLKAPIKTTPSKFENK